MNVNSNPDGLETEPANTFIHTAVANSHTISKLKLMGVKVSNPDIMKHPNSQTMQSLNLKTFAGGYLTSVQSKLSGNQFVGSKSIHNDTHKYLEKESNDHNTTNPYDKQTNNTSQRAGVNLSNFVSNYNDNELQSQTSSHFKRLGSQDLIAQNYKKLPNS